MEWILTDRHFIQFGFHFYTQIWNLRNAILGVSVSENVFQLSGRQAHRFSVLASVY